MFHNYWRDIALIFLKLGGSLITDKHQPYTPDRPTLHRLALEIAAARTAGAAPRLLIGHGSGSFGHTEGDRYKTRQGVNTPEDWHGFSLVWQAARMLNQIVIDELVSVGLPVIAFPPSAAVITSARQIHSYNTAPIKASLDAGLIPLVNGDVVFDTQQGGTIVSTEEIFAYLAPILCPERILLAGNEPGVWADFPSCTQLITEISPESIPQIRQSLHGSASVDTTGGMLQKVTAMADLVQANSRMVINIFTGRENDLLRHILSGENHGTRISSGA